jgi:hypothetical protein
MDWEHKHRALVTAALEAGTRKFCNKMNIILKANNKPVIMNGEEFEQKKQTAVGIGRLLIQKILRPNKITNLIDHKCHVASFETPEKMKYQTHS